MSTKSSTAAARAANGPVPVPVRDQLSDELLTPLNAALVLIDYQPEMIAAVQSIDRQILLNNVAGLARTAKIFNLPVILTTVGAMSSLTGPMLPQIQEVFPDITPIDRSTMNAWEDPRVAAAIEKTGRRKLIMGALWTEVCLAFPALDALRAGYEVYPVSDASGGTSVDAHERAMARMILRGAQPVTWIGVMCELQRDWARHATYAQVMNVAKKNGQAWGTGIMLEEWIRGLPSIPELSPGEQYGFIPDVNGVLVPRAQATKNATAGATNGEKNGTKNGGTPTPANGAQPGAPAKSTANA